MDDVDWSVDYLCNIVRLTIRLIEKNALVPQCFYTPQYYGCLRWIPAFYYEAVINLCKSYCNDCPEDLITFDGEKIRMYEDNGEETNNGWNNTLLYWKKED